MFISSIGYLAGILFTISFLPQVLKTWRTKNVKGISLLMFIFSAGNCSLWIIYGIMRQDGPILFANSISFIFIICIIIMKVLFEKRSGTQGSPAGIETHQPK